MSALSRIVGTALAAAGIVALAAAPAAARCTKLAFSVNDYGKDGPTKDAKALLDTYIAKWAADNKIAKYNVGKKDVNCELFLNFIVFDEHTCKATATVCFNEPAGGVTLPQEAKASADKPVAAKKADDAAPKAAQVKPARAPIVSRAKPTETGTVPAAPAAKAEPAKAVTVTKPAPAPAAVAPAAAPAAPDKAAEAAAAAEKAAAAAERAAAAAERAAAAAAKAPAAAAAPATAPAAATPKAQ